MNTNHSSSLSTAHLSTTSLSTSSRSSSVYFSLHNQQQQFYLQALAHLGFSVDVFQQQLLQQQQFQNQTAVLSAKGELQQMAEKEYLGDRCILVHPEQLQSWKKQERINLSEEGFSALSYLAAREPIVGRVFMAANPDIQNDQQESQISFALSTYLQWLSKKEFPQLYLPASKDFKDSEEKHQNTLRELSLIFPREWRPFYLLETPSGLMEKLYSIQKKKDELRKAPLSKIGDTIFLQQLQQMIHPLQEILGSLQEIPQVQPLAEFMDITEDAEDTEITNNTKVTAITDVNEKATAFSAVSFRVGEEEIYVISGKGQIPLCLGIFSSQEKQRQYHISGLTGMTRYQPEGSHSILKNLLARKCLSINREYGVKQLASLETMTLRKRGFSLITAGELEQGKRLVQLRLSTMERYALLPELFSQGEQTDYTMWQALQESIMQDKELSSLPEEQLIHFIETTHPVIKKLFSKIQPAGSYRDDEQTFSQQFFTANEEYKKALLAGKIAEYLPQKEKKEIIFALQKVIGTEHDKLIQEVLEVLV